jgi:hypothetical protein
MVVARRFLFLYILHFLMSLLESAAFVLYLFQLHTILFIQESLHYCRVELLLEDLNVFPLTCISTQCT